MASSTITAPTTGLTDEHMVYECLLALGLQHVLVIYAGTVAVPLIMGGALHLPKEQFAFPINTDLPTVGLTTLIQTFDTWKFGICMSVMMGMIFTPVGLMITIGTDSSTDLLGIYGAVIVAGLFGIVATPLMGCVFGFSPPVVMGTVTTLIGMLLTGVDINWVASSQPIMKTVVDGVLKTVPNPTYGDLSSLDVVLAVLVIISLPTKYGRDLIGNIAALLGIVIDILITMAFGKVSFAGITEADWVAVITSLYFSMSTFHFGVIISMCIVILITLVESTDIFLAPAEIIGEKLSTNDPTRGLRADGLDTVIGSVFSTFSYTSFSQNVRLVMVTGVRPRFVAAMGSVILTALGLFPKMTHITVPVPSFILGRAGIAMFGMVTTTGVCILGSINFNKCRHNLFIATISVGFGIIPTLAPTLSQYLLHRLEPATHSGIVLDTLVAVILSLHYDGVQSAEHAMRDAATSTHDTE